MDQRSSDNEDQDSGSVTAFLVWTSSFNIHPETIVRSILYVLAETRYDILII